MPNYFKISIAKFMHVSIELPTYIVLCDINSKQRTQATFCGYLSMCQYLGVCAFFSNSICLIFIVPY